MTKAEIEAVFARVRGWPQDRQADLAAIAVVLEEAPEPYELSPEEEEALDEAEAEEARGAFAADEEVEAIFRRRRTP